MSALSLSLMLFLLSFISQTRSSDLVRLLLSRDTVGLLAMAAPHYSLSNDLNADRADVCLYSMPLRWPPVQRRSVRALGRKRKLILASRNDLLCSRFGLSRQPARHQPLISSLITPSQQLCHPRIWTSTLSLLFLNAIFHFPRGYIGNTSRQTEPRLCHK